MYRFLDVYYTELVPTLSVLELGLVWSGCAGFVDPLDPKEVEMDSGLGFIEPPDLEPTLSVFDLGPLVLLEMEMGMFEHYLELRVVITKLKFETCWVRHRLNRGIEY